MLSRFGLRFRQNGGQYLPLAQLWEINDRAALSYVPQVYPGRITNFRPVKQYALNEGPELGWNRVAAEGVDTYTLPVYPAGMLVEPFVGMLAEKIKACIYQSLRSKNS